jgi:hypothetical protein
MNKGAKRTLSPKFLIKMSFKEGGRRMYHATVNLSQIHWFKKLTAAIGKRTGIPRPYIKVIYVMLSVSDYL